MFIKVGHQSHLLSSPHPATVPTKESRGITNKTACWANLLINERRKKGRKALAGHQLTAPLWASVSPFVLWVSRATSGEAMEEGRVSTPGRLGRDLMPTGPSPQVASGWHPEL